MQSPAPSPQALAINLQENNNNEHSARNRSLCAKALLRTSLRRPAHLQITDGEAAQRPALIQPRADLARTLGVAVEIIAGDGDGCDHDAEDVETPCERSEHVMIPSLKAEAEKDEAGDHEGRAEPNDGQARLGFQDAVVSAHVHAAYEVVEPVAENEADESGHDGSEVEEACSPNIRSRFFSVKQWRSGCTYRLASARSCTAG